MSRLLAACLLILSLSLFVGCRQQNETKANEATPDQPMAQNLPPETTAALPDAEGGTLIGFITESQDYRQWPLFPGKEPLYQGQHPHGAYLTTYVSPAVLAALQSKSGKLPDGAVIVKENYSPQKELAAVTVMYRSSGYNPEAGDWFWLKYAPDKTILAEGKVDGCIQCHRAVQNNDWVFTGPVK